jgi:hypothetical protein
MTAKVRKIESPAANESFAPENFSREETMIAEHASGPLLEHDAPDRKLRNRIILANVVAWIMIIVLIRLLFL